MAIGSGANMTMGEFVAAMDAKSVELATLPIARDLEMEAKEAVYTGIANNFVRTQGSGGLSWPAHAPATVRKYGPHPLLILSGTMKASATESGAPGNVEMVGDQSMVLGTLVPYAAHHQYGAPRANIPQREFFYVNEEAIEELEAMTHRYASAAV